jgi:hypothetical protein
MLDPLYCGPRFMASLSRIENMLVMPGIHLLLILSEQFYFTLFETSKLISTGCPTRSDFTRNSFYNSMMACLSYPGCKELLFDI